MKYRFFFIPKKIPASRGHMLTRLKSVIRDFVVSAHLVHLVCFVHSGAEMRGASLSIGLGCLESFLHLFNDILKELDGDVDENRDFS